MGNGQFIHASSGARKVAITSLDKKYYQKEIHWGKKNKALSNIRRMNTLKDKNSPIENTLSLLRNSIKIIYYFFPFNEKLLIPLIETSSVMLILLRKPWINT